MAISVAQQKAVWALPETALSDASKAVWQLLADYGQTYNTSDYKTVISQQSGNGISVTEVAAAITELGSKGFLQYGQFTAIYPTTLPPV
jgi:hypothetical protein